MNQSGDRSRRRFLKTSSMLSLAVAFNPWKVFADSKSEIGQKENNMVETSAAQPSREHTTDKNAIRPFRWNFSEAQLFGAA